MEETLEIHSSVLTEHTELLDSIFRMYIEDINPFVVQFEISKGEFPAELQDEIRAVYGHLVRASISDTSEQVVRNIEKMGAHSRRALLDCFKYTSIVCSDNYDSFMKRYEGVDLTYLDNGNFLPDVVTRCNKARKALQSAKIAETSNVSEDSLFELYQDTYGQFEKLNERIQQAEESAAFLRYKASKKDIMAQISLGVGIAGTVVGIAGFAVGVLSVIIK